jgi:hypothetical protein
MEEMRNVIDSSVGAVVGVAAFKVGGMTVGSTVGVCVDMGEIVIEVAGICTPHAEKRKATTMILMEFLTRIFPRACMQNQKKEKWKR